MVRLASRAVLGLLVLLTATGAVAQSAVDAAGTYLRQDPAAVGLASADLADLVVADQHVSRVSGATHIYFQQAIDGVPVLDAIVNVSVARDGAVLSAASRAIPNLRASVGSSAQALSAADGVRAAAQALDVAVDLSAPERLAGLGEAVAFTNEASGEAVRAQLMYVPVDRGVELAWVVVLSSTDGDHLWQAAVSAGTGALLRQDDLSDEDHWAVDDHMPEGWGVAAPIAPERASSLVEIARMTGQAPVGAPAGAMTGQYRVYDAPFESPSHAGNATADLRTLVATAGDPTASPFGWHSTGVTSYTITRGNNVHAGVDLVAPNGIDPGTEPDGGAGLLFDYTFDPATQSAASYRDAAVTNLFFWNNLIHDVMWFYGFDEASGNFQAVNTPGVGSGNDAVNADAQDYSGTNNANFGTPPDGSAPRMQMFVWTSAFVNELSYGATTAEMTGAAFGAAYPGAGITQPAVLVNDGTALPNEGCSPLVNGGAILGNLAVVYRGSCAFTVKVKNAQNAGAVGVIVINNAGGNPITLGGADGTVVIPSGMISDVAGAALVAALPETVTVRNLGASQLDRDSDFDNGIIVHEYGHGISNRLTGGRFTTSCLGVQEQMGEGWSDYYALMLTDTNTDGRGIGTYVIYEPTTGRGIRPFRYSSDMSVNPATYDFTKTAAVPHGVGFVWATMLWDMTRNLVDRYGFDADLYAGTGGNNTSLALVTEGLKMQPCSPGFVDGRDAILAADQAITGGANQCLIWDSFARRGLGASANQGASTSSTDGTEAFDLPLSCATSSMLEEAIRDLRAVHHITNPQAAQLANKIRSAREALAASPARPDIAINRLDAVATSIQNIGATRPSLTPTEVQNVVDLAQGNINRINEDYPSAPAAATEPGGTTRASASTGLPTEFALDQNAPNPVGGTATIQFALPVDAHVRLVVYDVMGRAVAEVTDQAYPAGFHLATVDTRGLASGTYVYRIEAGDFVATHRMTVVR